jgi:hypothetical protein
LTKGTDTVRHQVRRTERRSSVVKEKESWLLVPNPFMNSLMNTFQSIPRRGIFEKTLIEPS